MTLFFIGQLLEVKPVEFEDRKTGKISYSTEITALFEGVDEEGYKKISAETVKMDEEYATELKTFIGKHVAIPYFSETNQYGTRTYPDRSMPVLQLDKSILDFSSYERTESKRTESKSK